MSVSLLFMLSVYPDLYLVSDEYNFITLEYVSIHKLSNSLCGFFFTFREVTNVT